MHACAIDEFVSDTSVLDLTFFKCIKVMCHWVQIEKKKSYTKSDGKDKPVKNVTQRDPIKRKTATLAG